MYVRATSSTGEHAGSGSTTYKPHEFQEESFRLVHCDKTASPRLDPSLPPMYVSSSKLGPGQLQHCILP